MTSVTAAGRRIARLLLRAARWGGAALDIGALEAGLLTDGFESGARGSFDLGAAVP